MKPVDPTPRSGQETGGPGSSSCHTVPAASRDLSRAVVYPANAESAREDGFPLVARFALLAFNR